MKYFILIIAFIAITSIYAQEIDRWVVDAHDSDNNVGSFRSRYWWYVHADGQRQLESPFYSYGHTALGFLANQGMPKDLGCEWVVLHAHLGNSVVSLYTGSTARVVLYNTRLGILRLFTMRVHEAFTGLHTQSFAKLVVENNSTGIISTINTGENFILPLERRNNTNSFNTKVKYFETFDGGWIFADFFVAYDYLQPLNTDILRFWTRGVDVAHHDLQSSDNMVPEFTTPNRSTGVLDVLLAGSPFQFFRDADAFIDFMGGFASRSDGDSRFINFGFITAGFKYLVASRIVDIPDWIRIGMDALDFFSGSGSGSNNGNGNGSGGGSVNINKAVTIVVKSEFSGSVSGTSKTAFNVSDFQIRQPGAPGGNIQISNPLYNYPLGTVQLASMPFNPRRFNVGNGHSFRFDLEPLQWRVNTHTGLIPIPREVNVSYNFRIRAIGDDDLTINNILRDELFNFITVYNRRTDGNAQYFYCFTHKLSPEDFNGIVLNTTYANIHSLGLRVMAIFDYENTSIDPYVFVANYQVLHPHNMITPPPGLSLSAKPLQRVRVIYEDTILTENFFLNHTIIVEYGKTLTLQDITVNHWIIPNDTRHYGIRVQNGTLVLNNSKINLRDGTIIAIGENSSIEIKSTNNSKGITTSTGGRIIVDGASMTVDNSTVTINSNTIHGQLLLRNHARVYFVNNSRFYLQDRARIVGHEPFSILGGMIADSAPESIIITDTNSRIHDGIGDFIRFKNSHVEFGRQTRIVTGNQDGRRWGGIGFLNCDPNDTGENINFTDASKIESNISGIQSLEINNSTVAFNGTAADTLNITGIRRFFILENSNVRLNHVKYDSNSHAIWSTGSFVEINDSKILNNEYHGLRIQNSNKANSRNIVKNTIISDNASSGVLISGSAHANFTNVSITRNTSRGFLFIEQC